MEARKSTQNTTKSLHFYVMTKPPVFREQIKNFNPIKRGIIKLWRFEVRVPK